MTTIFCEVNLKILMSLQSKNMTSIWIKKAIVLEQLNIHLRNSEFNKIPEFFMPSIYNMLGICSKGWKTANDTKYCIYSAGVNKITILFQVTDGSDSANELLNTCDDLTNQKLNSKAHWMTIYKFSDIEIEYHYTVISSRSRCLKIDNFVTFPYINFIHC